MDSSTGHISLVPRREQVLESGCCFRQLEGYVEEDFAQFGPPPPPTGTPRKCRRKVPDGYNTIG
jgi:hypothetical protein